MKIKTIEIDEFDWLQRKNLVSAIIDVREESFFKKGHIRTSRNFPGKFISNYIPTILDFIETGVEDLYVISKKSCEYSTVVELALRTLGVNIIFVNFDSGEWKEIGGEKLERS
jgi:hypothetical protein